VAVVLDVGGIEDLVTLAEMVLMSASTCCEVKLACLVCGQRPSDDGRRRASQLWKAQRARGEPLPAGAAICGSGEQVVGGKVEAGKG